MRSSFIIADPRYVAKLGRTMREFQAQAEPFYEGVFEFEPDARVSTRILNKWCFLPTSQ
jgi:hypothetical protein